MSIFNTMNIKAPGLNKFDLSYTNLITMNMGDLVPVMVKDMLPGDKFRVKTDSFVRLMPLANPAFQNLRLYFHYFFVPNRLVWNNWERFITGGSHGLDGIRHGELTTINPTPPYMALGGFSPLLDALNYGHLQASPTTNSAGTTYRLRAYWLIYNEWYRDQNIDNAVYFDKDLDGYDDYNNWKYYTPNNELISPPTEEFSNFARRRYLKDYFTSALPWPQRGNEVVLPFGGEASLINNSDYDIYTKFDTGYSGSDPDNVVTGTLPDDFPLQTVKDGKLWNLKNTLKDVKVDLQNVTSATINDLRRAVSLQRFFEISARGGSRYIETILSHFGVHSKDSRLQRPEFLGGGMTPIQIGEVLQTTPTTDSPLATMAGRGYARGFGNENGCVYRATEHGMLFCIASIVPESLYWQGIDRMVQKFDRLDYYWPSFAHLGEQEIKRKELYYSGSTLDDETFGYSPRYSEYKHSRNEVHGDFVTDPLLKNWHFGREFTQSPALTSEFLEIPDITGPFAVQDGSKYLCQIHHTIDALRPMPYYSDPRLI